MYGPKRKLLSFLYNHCKDLPGFKLCSLALEFARNESLKTPLYLTTSWHVVEKHWQKWCNFVPSFIWCCWSWSGYRKDIWPVIPATTSYNSIKVTVVNLA